MFKKLSLLMLFAGTMVTKPADVVSFDCLSRDKDYYNSDEMVYRRKHKCGCEQFCCINTATLTVSGIANFNGSSFNVRNQFNLAGVNINNLLGISGTAGINDGSAAVGLVDSTGAATNSEGATGLGLTTFGSWYSTAGASVLVNGVVPFATAAGASSIITHPSSTEFVLPVAGTYEVTWFATVNSVLTTGAQLSLFIDGTLVPQGVVGTGANLSVVAGQLFGTAFVTTTVANAVLDLRNTGAATNTLTFATTGGANTSVAGITIKRIA